MPTNQTTYNSRVTDEALEKRFRDTFRSQGGAELVDDLYASGVIVPVVDFTAAAEGSQLPSNLQTAWDFATVNVRQLGTGTNSIVSTPGFYKFAINWELLNGAGPDAVQLNINDGLTSKAIWKAETGYLTTGDVEGTYEGVVFLRSGDSFEIQCANQAFGQVSARQIADVYGNLIVPVGFTSS
jgi:hypothetical protein